MAFAMKGGGSQGGLDCHLPILKNGFFKRGHIGQGYLKAITNCLQLIKICSSNREELCTAGAGSSSKLLSIPQMCTRVDESLRVIRLRLTSDLLNFISVMRVKIFPALNVLKLSLALIISN